MDKKELKELLLPSDSSASMIRASMVIERKLIKLHLHIGEGVLFEFPEDATAIDLGRPIQGSDKKFHTFDLSLRNDKLETFSKKLQLWAYPSSFYLTLDVEQQVFVKFLGNSFAGALARMFAFEKIYVPHTVNFFVC